MLASKTGYALTIDRSVRKRVARLSGANASRCYQCATCSAVCDLSQGETAFPRKQMQYAQMGLLDKMKADSTIWLCHQCNDCSVHCPKDVRPGDIMAGMRALLICENAVFKPIGRMFEEIGKWWPVVIGIPVAIWFFFFLILFGSAPFSDAAAPFQFEALVPHWMIYAVNIPVLLGAIVALGISGLRLWKNWGVPDATFPMKMNAFYQSGLDIFLHRKMSICKAAKQRNVGHFMVMWGFIGAFVTTSVIAGLLFFTSAAMPLPFFHPMKMLGNAAGGLMLLGGLFILYGRLCDEKKMGQTTSFDSFFILLLLAVVATGFGAQFFRIAQKQPIALGVYLLHLGLVLSLFVSLPFSKFSHVLYRLLAETRMHLISPKLPKQSPKPVSVYD